MPPVGVLLYFTIVLFLIVVVLFLREQQDSEDVYSDDYYVYSQDNIYLYRKDEFPLNVYFSTRTRRNPKFQTLYNATVDAIQNFNEAFGFTFFVLQSNINQYANTVLIQIACGFHYGCISNFDGEGGVLAHATFPPQRKVCIDCRDINFTPLSMILMHEFGHIIGLIHTQNPHVPSLMQPFVDTKVTNFTRYDVWRVKQRFKFLR